MCKITSANTRTADECGKKEEKKKYIHTRSFCSVLVGYTHTQSIGTNWEFVHRNVWKWHDYMKLRRCYADCMVYAQHQQEKRKKKINKRKERNGKNADWMDERHTLSRSHKHKKCALSATQYDVLDRSHPQISLGVRVCWLLAVGIHNERPSFIYSFFFFFYLENHTFRVQITNGNDKNIANWQSTNGQSKHLENVVSPSKMDIGARYKTKMSYIWLKHAIGGLCQSLMGCQTHRNHM